MPILPYINDTMENIENIVTKAFEVGAKYIYASFGVTLRDKQRQHYFGKIGEPLTSKYIQQFGSAYSCTSPKAKELKKHFVTLCNKYGILYKMEDIVSMQREFIKTKQLSLF